MHLASATISPRRPPPRPVRAAAARPVPVTLALQGGGALGAFTWGVLDRLLDEPRLRIAAARAVSRGVSVAAVP